MVTLPGKFPVRVNQKASIEVIPVLRLNGAGPAFKIIGADHHPHMVAARQAAHNGSGIRVIAQEPGHTAFRPDQHVRLVGERLLGKAQEVLEALPALAGVPNHGLRNGRLHERQVYRAGRGGRVADVGSSGRLPSHAERRYEA